MVQGGTAHVHVEVGLQARGEGDLAAHDGQLLNELGEAGALGIVGTHGF
jgi:hypothetical protein